MFIGHFAVGFAAKRAAPQVNLGALILAPLLLDVLWPIFLLLGLETVRVVPDPNPFLLLDLHDYPYSHSLLMAIVWSALFAAIWIVATRDRRGAAILGLLVFSHWILDWVTHVPDMPLWPGSATYVGLGLWRSVAATVAIEGAMFVAGVAIYARATRARDRRGAIAWWSFAGLLAIFYVANLFSPPPPDDAKIIGVMGLALAVICLPWAWWADRHRVMRV
jgi:membrane-bound metal-dependent hydrolase YbcI (DUF457 family)